MAHKVPKGCNQYMKNFTSSWVIPLKVDNSYSVIFLSHTFIHCLSGKWLGVLQEHFFLKMCLKRDWTTCLKHYRHSRLNSQHLVAYIWPLNGHNVNEHLLSTPSRTGCSFSSYLSLLTLSKRATKFSLVIDGYSTIVGFNIIPTTNVDIGIAISHTIGITTNYCLLCTLPTRRPNIVDCYHYYCQWISTSLYRF